MADGGEQPEQPMEEVPAAAPRNMFHVKIMSARGMPEESSTVVEFRYSMLTAEEEEAALASAALLSGDGAKPVGVVEGRTAEFDEPPSGTEHNYKMTESFVLPPVTDLLLYRFITLPMEFRVQGLAVPGTVRVSLQDLVWRPDPKPDDPDEEDFLPDAPGSFIQGWFPLEPQDPLEEGVTFPEKAEMYIRLQISELLLPKDELQTLNVFTMTVESLHRLPPLWGPAPEEQGEDHAYVYKLLYTLPGMEPDSTLSVSIEPGSIAATKDEAEPGAENGGEAAKEEGAEGAFETEAADGDEPAPTRIAIRQDNTTTEKVEEDAYLQRTGSRVVLAEERKTASISFQHTTSIAMQASAIARLKTIFNTRNALQVELTRELRSGDPYVYKQKYHARIYVDADALLEPGATAAQVRCAVEPADDFRLPTTDELEATPSPGEPEPDTDGGANPYLLAETYLKLHLQTLRPLVPKPKPPPPVLPKVQDLLPTRAPVKAYAPPALGAEQFKADVEGIILELADEYHALFLAEGASDVPLEKEGIEGVDARRQRAIFELNKSGRYYDYKERLKKSTIAVVRESFFKEGLDPTSEDGKRAMSKLYVDLQDLINLKLNAAFSAPKKPSPTASETELAKFIADRLRLAEEAQSLRVAEAQVKLDFPAAGSSDELADMNLDFPLASSHLNTCIISDPTNAALWYDYGVLCVKNGERPKAEECLRESLQLDPRFVPALLTYGVLLCQLDRFADAETYLTGATSFSPDDVLAWSLLILFYDMESRDLERRAAVKKVLELDKGKDMRRSPYLRAAEFCADLLAIQLVERAAMQQVKKHGDSTELQLILASAYMKVQQYERARLILGPNASKSGVLDKDKRHATALQLLGHVLFMEERWHKLRSDTRDTRAHKDVLLWFEKALTVKDAAADVLQLLRMARVYLWVGKYYEAKDVLIKACRLKPSASTWLGLGIACLHQKETDQAQQALCEANILDPHNAQVWGMLCVVACTLNKFDEAEMAMKYALKFGLNTAETWPVGYGMLMVEQMATLYYKEGQYGPAASLLIRGLETSYAPSLNKMLGEVYLMDNELSLAAAAFENVVQPDANAAPAETLSVLTQLVHVSRRLKRSRETRVYEEKLKEMGFAPDGKSLPK